MSALIDFPIPDPDRDVNAKAATGRHSAANSEALRSTSARSAATLLRQARAGIAEAQAETDPAQRYACAYLAALRAAAAMLALRGRPHRGRARPASAWVLLSSLAPELREWAEYFAEGSSRRAAILAGVTRGVTQRSADDLVRSAAQFADLVGEAVHGRAALGLAPAAHRSRT